MNMKIQLDKLDKNKTHESSGLVAYALNFELLTSFCAAEAQNILQLFVASHFAICKLGRTQGRTRHPVFIRDQIAYQS